MKILYIHNSPYPGGMEQHVLNLVEGMLEKGHEVFVICPKGVPSEWYKTAGAFVLNDDIKSDIDLGYINRMSGFAKDKKIDVIHAHELKAVTNALLAGKKANIKVLITHQHTPLSDWKTWGSAIKKKLTILVYSSLVNLFATKEICITKVGRTTKLEEGIATNKLFIIPNAIDLNRFFLSSDERLDYSNEIRTRYGIKAKYIVGTVGRLSPEKGHKTLIKAFREFLKTEKYKEDYHLLLAGGGELEHDLTKLCMENDIKNFTITGKFDSEDLPKFYCCFDLFIFPTLAEGFGLVLLEALASGTPVISSDLPVLKEVGSNYVRYFRTGDDSDLAINMKEYFDGHSMNVNSQDLKNYLLSNYDLRIFIDNYECLYLDSLKAS